jgi:hypothetical protein
VGSSHYQAQLCRASLANLEGCISIGASHMLQHVKEGGSCQAGKHSVSPTPHVANSFVLLISRCSVSDAAHQGCLYDKQADGQTVVAVKMVQIVLKFGRHRENVYICTPVLQACIIFVLAVK